MSYAIVYNRCFMIIISDTSSLILLEKASLLETLVNINKITIPKQVFKEAVEEGLKRNFVDAVKINQLIRNKKINVKEVIKKKNFSISLGSGEKEAIELFYQEKADKIIVDDKKVLTLCGVLNIPYLTVHSILLGLFKKGLINKQKAIMSLEILSKEGRYSNDIVLYYYEKINKGD